MGRSARVVVGVFSAFALFSMVAWQTPTLDVLSVQEMTLFNTFSHVDAPVRAPSRKVVLLGAFDRYNFGDLLFDKVVTTLLVHNAGYAPEDIVYGGIVSVDMSGFGGNPNILDMKKVQEMSHTDGRGPFDIVMVGGEVAGCDHSRGVGMLPTIPQRESAEENKIAACAYAIDKQLLVPPNCSSPTNIAILNSVGGSAGPRGRHFDGTCRSAFDAADYKSYRDGADDDPLVFPDSAVMVKRLFGAYVSNVTNFPRVADILQEHGDYVAIQHRALDGLSLDSQQDIARTLDAVAELMESVIVFFCAGTAPHHDSFAFYREIAMHMAKPSVVFTEENVWYVAALIAHSRATLGTSLHVRIMSFIFQRPRITWLCAEKHRQFLRW